MSRDVLPRRGLALQREQLSELASEEMRSVLGGTHIATDCPCLTHGYSCDYCSLPTSPLASCSERCITTIVPPVTGGADR